MSRHNLGAVVRFEIGRTLSKKRFWIGTLAVPVAMAIVFLLIFVSNSSGTNSADEQKSQRFSIVYTDSSSLISSRVAESLGAKVVATSTQGIAAVKSGEVDAYFDFSSNLSSTPVEVYGADKGLFENGKYAAVAQQMVSLSVKDKIGSPEIAKIAQSGVKTTVKTFQGETEAGGLNSVIPPLIFLLIFYGLILVLASQMLNSTLEEKENRVTEMILTTLRPTTLLTGKVIALFLIGLIQMIIFVTPVAIGYFFAKDSLQVPSFDISSLTFDPLKMTIGVLLLIGGFALFMTTLVAVGAVMPTAKDAGAFLGIIIVLMFIPFYAVALIVTNPSSIVVQIFTYFPFFAPITAMLRNGFGSLSLAEAAIVIVILFVSAFVMLRVAVQLFQYGSIEYSRKVSIRSAFARKRP